MEVFWRAVAWSACDSYVVQASYLTSGALTLGSSGADRKAGVESPRATPGAHQDSLEVGMGKSVATTS